MNRGRFDRGNADNADGRCRVAFINVLGGPIHDLFCPASFWFQWTTPHCGVLRCCPGEDRIGISAAV